MLLCYDRKCSRVDIAFFLEVNWFSSYCQLLRLPWNFMKGVFRGIEGAYGGLLDTHKYFYQKEMSISRIHLNALFESPFVIFLRFSLFTISDSKTNFISWCKICLLCNKLGGFDLGNPNWHLWLVACTGRPSKQRAKY